MGGSALDVKTERLSDDDYKALRPRIRREIEHRTAAEQVYMLRAIAEKNSHGDVDLLVQTDDRESVEAGVANIFDATETYKNGPAFSMDARTSVPVPNGGRRDLPPFQLDLVFVPEDQWEMTKVFFDWNDLGNLMGKVARYHRYKLGFQGLRLPYWRDLDRSQKLGEYVLTRDPQEALDFLGYDYERHRAGFETFEDMFEYAFSSDLAVPQCFMSHQLTASQRQRDSTRDVYQQFMKWLEDQRPYDFIRRPSYRRAREVAEKHFPGVNKNIRHDKKTHKRQEAAAEIFNGENIYDELGLEGKDIGILLRKLESVAEEKTGDWDSYRLAMGRNAMLTKAKIIAETIL